MTNFACISCSSLTDNLVENWTTSADSRGFCLLPRRRHQPAYTEAWRGYGAPKYILGRQGFRRIRGVGYALPTSMLDEASNKMSQRGRA